MELRIDDIGGSPKEENTRDIVWATLKKGKVLVGGENVMNCNVCIGTV